MRIVRKITVLVFCIVITYIALPFLISPIYDFSPPHTFEGKSFYNPYQDINTLQLLKANFHYHSNTWGIITDGRNSQNTAPNIKSKFSSHGYNMISISDYMSINPESPVRLYEHGMGAYKAHRLVMGSSNVLWLDFIPLHNVHHKQFMINLLKSDSNMIALAHPSWNNAYTPTDVKVLGNYDCFEIQNSNKESLALWDSALSAGKPVFLMADDDGHDIDDLGVTARIFTFLFAKDSSESSVIYALKRGQSMGVAIPWQWNPDTALRHAVHREILIPDTISYSQNTYYVHLPDTVKEIKIIGNQGRILKLANNINEISYPVLLSDSYVRTEITLKNEVVLYLNPIVRCDESLSKIDYPEVNIWKTIFIQIALWPLYIVLFYRVMKAGKKTKITDLS
jgi:hypothetical protein